MNSHLLSITIHISKKVCDAGFDLIDANSACLTLGYHSGSYQTISQDHWLDKIPISMNNGGCTSSKDNFLHCPHKQILLNQPKYMIYSQYTINVWYLNLISLEFDQRQDWVGPQSTHFCGYL